MGIFHDQAAAALVKLKESTSSTFREALDDAVPGWRSSAAGQSGYGDPRHHVNLPVGRAMFDVLPVPFSSARYDWTITNGFEPVLAYVDQSGRTKDEIVALIDAAIVRNDVIAND